MATINEYFKEQILTFNDFSVEKLVRRDLGITGFEELIEKISTARSMLNEALIIVEKQESIPNIYLDALMEYIEGYIANANNFLSYDPEKQVNSAQIKMSYINAFNEYYSSMLLGTDQHRKMQFITLYNYLKQKQLDTASSALTGLQNIKDQYDATKTQIDALLISLQDKAKVVSLHDYSQVFAEQSKVHSNNGEGKRGNAQGWMIATIVMVVVFIGVIAGINKIYPITTDGNATIITIEYITRVLIISFVIYAITFCTKQYNIQKHLATVNKHRENTLNSYKLFIESLGDTSSDVKDALMMEVAKAIYESGQTGYLGSNDKSDSAPSMIELTKYVRGDKG